MHFETYFKSCARHKFRDNTMKKILTLAIVALLMGGFALNADAQNRKAAKPVKKEAVSTKKKVATVETTNAAQSKATQTQKVASDENEKLIKTYEQAVDKCLEVYKAIQKGENAKNTNFDKLLANAEELKAKIEKSKDSLTEKQADRFKKANSKLMQVYTKG